MSGDKKKKKYFIEKINTYKITLVHLKDQEPNWKNYPTPKIRTRKNRSRSQFIKALIEKK